MPWRAEAHEDFFPVWPQLPQRDPDGLTVAGVAALAAGGQVLADVGQPFRQAGTVSGRQVPLSQMWADRRVRCRHSDRRQVVVAQRYRRRVEEHVRIMAIEPGDVDGILDLCVQQLAHFVWEPRPDPGVAQLVFVRVAGRRGCYHQGPRLRR